MSKRMVDLKVADGKVTSINGYELGGSGGSGSETGVSVTKFEPKTISEANQLVKWKNDEGFTQLQPNTQYEVGDSFVLRYQMNIAPETLAENQIIVPVNVYISPTKSQNTLTYGDVILSCAGVRTSPSYTSNSANKYIISTSCYITYTVVKAGTTGPDVTLPSAPKTYLRYLIYTFGATKAS